MTDRRFVDRQKIRENRLRRVADRQGYMLVKSRSRDPHAVDYRLYALHDVQTGGAVNPSIAGRWTCSWNLDEVERWLAPESPNRKHRNDETR